MSADSQRPEASDESSEFFSDVVYQAQGAVSTGRGVDVDQALQLMQMYADKHDMSLLDLAELIMSEAVTLETIASDG